MNLSEDHELTHDIRLELNTVKLCLIELMRAQVYIYIVRISHTHAYTQTHTDM